MVVRTPFSEKHDQHHFSSRKLRLIIHSCSQMLEEKTKTLTSLYCFSCVHKPKCKQRNTPQSTRKIKKKKKESYEVSVKHPQIVKIKALVSFFPLVMLYNVVENKYIYASMGNAAQR